MNVQRDIESTVTVGDYANGDGVKLFMDRDGVAVQTETTMRTSTIGWDMWPAVVAEVARFLAVTRES